MKNILKKRVFLLLALPVLAAGCKTTIYPGEVGITIRKGKITQGVLGQGRHHYNPFVSRVYKFSTLINEFSTTMSPPTKEGLEVKVDLTLLYHIKPDAAPDIYTRVGMDYGRKIVINNFMAIVRQYTMTYTAVELLNERETIEKNIEDKLRTDVSGYGVVIDDVLVKDIDMPASVLKVIEDKAKAEQLAKQTRLELQTKREQEDFDLETRRKELEFALDKQKSEAERMQIDANAIKDYQASISQTLTDKMLKYKSIEVTKELVKSANAKIIITDGKTMMLNNIGDK